MMDKPSTGSIPTGPGSYQFFDSNGRVIYVGKAKSLRNRLTSYFVDSAKLAPRTAEMVAAAERVEWIQVSSELEALLLEHTLIRQFRPRFNIALVDDESYPWLALTLGEAWPRVIVTRHRNIRGAKYFGPFPHRGALKDTLDLALATFSVRSCSSGTFKQHQALGRPCLLFDIKKCCGPCIGVVSREEYSVLLNDFSDVFTGKSVELERRIKNEMLEASDTLDFEKAARKRDQLESIEVISTKQQVVSDKRDHFDVIGLAEDGVGATVCVFKVRTGMLIGRRLLTIDKVEDLSGGRLIARILEMLYGDAGAGLTPEDVPKSIYVPSEPQDMEVYVEFLTSRRGSAVRLLVPRRGGKAALLETATKNAVEAMSRAKLKRASDHDSRSRALLAIQNAVGMSVAPLRIECYDMSHLQGTDYVGSMVVFEDGMAAKREYRKFNIKFVPGNDDYAAMEEVLTRRLTALIESRTEHDRVYGEYPDADTGATSCATGVKSLPNKFDSPTRSKAKRFSYPPQLILLDGGKGQLGVGVAVLERLGLRDEIAIASLAKSFEEVFIPGKSDPVILDDIDAQYLLQRARDEAHRFAIGTHRKRRGKRMTKSVVDGIPGLGEKRKKRLLKELGGIDAVKSASLEELLALSWLPKAVASDVFARINRENLSM